MTNLSPTACQHLNVYQQALQQHADLRPATIRNYLGDVRLFMLWWEQHHPDLPFSVERNSTPTLLQYRTYLQHDAQCQPATINRYLISLKRYFAWAFEHEQIPHNPALVVKLVGYMPPAPRQITDDEESALVAAAQSNRRDYTLLVLILHTGLRVEEVCALKRDHITLGKRSGHLQVWGKGGKYRTIPLNATARQVVSSYLTTHGSVSGYLFESQRTHTRLTPRAVGFVVSKYAEQAGVVDVSPHDLRHRFGYRMAQRVPLHYLAQLMGHDSLDTTLVYIQATAEDLQQAVERIAWE